MRIEKTAKLAVKNKENKSKQTVQQTGGSKLLRVKQEQEDYEYPLFRNATARGILPNPYPTRLITWLRDRKCGNVEAFGSSMEILVPCANGMGLIPNVLIENFDNDRW
ncbi:hypothetical protein C5167_008110 [Papaver somniferum]|uniref:Uncharacterized protein n=1 Tax=Papaver somniferum TaxID=3469 RepID=A0A4Y7JXG6_PAPSO|nr:hypothetical protein C5167_008110 [Papaver somniferum]